MEANKGQYEQVARFLDGEDVSLDADTLALAEEIRGLEAAVAEHLEIAVPASAIRRAQRRLLAATAGPPRRSIRVRIVAVGGTAAAVAAIILLTFSLLWEPVVPTGGRVDGNGRIAALPHIEQDVDIPTDVLLGFTVSGNGFDLELDLIAEQLDEEESEITVGRESVMLDAEILDLQEKIRVFWVNDQWDMWDEISLAG